MSELHEVPLPTMIGASHIEEPTKPKSRVTGAPSQKFPIIRDLAASPATITIEIDTEKKRQEGVIESISRGDRGQYLHIKGPKADPGRSRGAQILLQDIIAFRVLKVEVEELPVDL